MDYAINKNIYNKESHYISVVIFFIITDEINTNISVVFIVSITFLVSLINILENNIYLSRSFCSKTN